MPEPSSPGALHPRSRWFLHALSHCPDAEADDWRRFDDRLPPWDDEANPLEGVWSVLAAAGWVTLAAEGVRLAEGAGAHAPAIAAAFEADRPEWRTRLNAWACEHAGMARDHPVTVALAALDRRSASSTPTSRIRPSRCLDPRPVPRARRCA